MMIFYKGENAMRCINVFFASASDAGELLQIAKKEVDAINSVVGGTVHYNILDWKKCTVSSMGNPEEEILKQMPIDESNYFVGVFRFKYGEPTGTVNPDTGKPYKSGMEEEFFRAYRLWQQYKRPEIIIFRSEEDVPRAYALKSDLVELEKFFKDFEATGKHPGLYNTYKNKEEFAEKFRKNILQRLVKELQSDVPEEYRNYIAKKDKGFIEIYFDGESEKRNKVKQQEIFSTSVLKLQANSGYSFIGKGTIHNPSIRKALERGMQFQIIMQNPWSLNAIYLALKSSDFQNKQKYNQYLHHKLSASEIIEVYKKSHWKNERFQYCMNGYEELKKEFKDRIQLKVSDRDLSNSVLITDNYLLLEPYYNTIEAAKKSISVFEVQIDKNSDLYKDTNSYFDVLWNSGYTYRKFKQNEKKFEERLKEYLEKGI